MRADVQDLSSKPALARLVWHTKVSHPFAPDQARMRTAIAQAGAERGFLILPLGNEQRLAAQATIEGHTVALASEVMGRPARRAPSAKLLR